MISVDRYLSWDRVNAHVAELADKRAVPSRALLLRGIERDRLEGGCILLQLPAAVSGRVTG